MRSSQKKRYKLTLPYDVPANQFMNLEDKKISGSRNWAVWGRDFLSRYDPDALRYYLTINMPESKDSDWDWAEFVARNNNELVATWGNLANRVLSFCFRTWDGQVPAIDTAALRPSDLSLLAAIDAGFDTIGRQLQSVQLRAALQEALRLAALVNVYLDQTAPWSAVKKNKDEAAAQTSTPPYAPSTPSSCSSRRSCRSPLSACTNSLVISSRSSESNMSRW